MKNYTITVNGNVYDVTVEEREQVLHRLQRQHQLQLQRQHRQRLRKQQHRQEQEVSR